MILILIPPNQQKMAQTELAKLGSAEEDQEAFDKLRTSLTVKLSTIGHGTIRTKEEKRVSLRTFRGKLCHLKT